MWLETLKNGSSASQGSICVFKGKQGVNENLYDSKIDPFEDVAVFLN